MVEGQQLQQKREECEKKKKQKKKNGKMVCRPKNMILVKCKDAF